MDLLPSTEQLEIISVVGSFLRSEMPINDIRMHRDRPVSVDPSLWRRCGDLGWFGLGLSESLGGVGYGLADEALVFRELGRHLAPGPFVASVLGAHVAARAGAGEIAAAILSGDTAVGWGEARTDDGRVGATVSGAYDTFDAPGSEYMLFVGPDAAALVETSALGRVTDLASIDPAVRLGRIEVDAVAAAVVLEDGPSVARRGVVLVAALLVGIAEATRDLSTEYAKVREQFGRPIGVNQAIKHACADMATRAEAATAQLLFAALSVDEELDDASFHVEAARIVAGRAAIDNATATIQVHGGMGYTFEHDAHLFLKRARVVDRQLGETRRHMAALLARPAPQ